MNPTEIEIIAAQAAKLNDLAKLMDDAEGARTGRDSGIALMLQDIATKLYWVASQSMTGDGKSEMTYMTREILDVYLQKMYTARNYHPPKRPRNERISFRRAGNRQGSGYRPHHGRS